MGSPLEKEIWSRVEVAASRVWGDHFQGEGVPEHVLWGSRGRLSQHALTNIAHRSPWKSSYRPSFAAVAAVAALELAQDQFSTPTPKSADFTS